jgi:YidC/Oxa1 family membrane protein insertase
MLFLVTNPVTRPLQLLLEYLNDQASRLPLPDSVSSWAVAVLVMAVIVKVVTQPLTSKQQQSMKRMQELQPKLAELQKRYKDDREKLSQAQMEMYKEQGVNPFGGCLPLIIQMVVLFGLWRAIMNLAGTESEPGRMAGARFLWIPDLSQCEPSPMCGGEFAMLPWAVPLLLIAMVISQMAYQHYLTPPTQSSDPQQQAMATMTKLMPLLFAYIFIRFPSGMVLYYTMFNAVGLLQMGASRLLQREALPGPGVPTDGAGTGTGPGAAGAATSSQEERERSEPASSERRRRRRKGR